uniref:Antibacterial peptide-1 n=1 Tax=Ancylostoma duodenale TaxID=51022 RepID=A0A0F6MXH5_9BILA|nr:antibacterial peptide-1 [Ancylostoma duodenale]
MNCVLICLALFVVVDQALSVYLTTCARMDVPIASRLAGAACIASCSAQNCATGKCKISKGRKTCICSRCANGGNFPLGDIIGLAKRGKK